MKMKKQYTTPETSTIVMETRHMLAGSPAPEWNKEVGGHGMDNDFDWNSPKD